MEFSTNSDIAEMHKYAWAGVYFSWGFVWLSP